MANMNWRNNTSGEAEKYGHVSVEKPDKYLRLVLVRENYYHNIFEHNVVTVLASGNALLTLPVNIGQTLYRLLNHFSMSKVSY